MSIHDKEDLSAIGCYGAGALGHQHTRESCAATLQYYRVENFISRGLPVPPVSPTGTFWGDGSGPYHVTECLNDLNNTMPDDGYDENAACDWLNEHAPFTGCYWGWQDGDFGLWADEDS